VIVNVFNNITVENKIDLPATNGLKQGPNEEYAAMPRQQYLPAQPYEPSTTTIKNTSVNVALGATVVGPFRVQNPRPIYMLYPGYCQEPSDREVITGYRPPAEDGNKRVDDAGSRLPDKGPKK
jgi:hypothetical protein